MPLYEYYCSDCRTQFTALRPMSQADTPMECENCEGNHTARVLSVFYARTANTGGETAALGGGGGCACGGACSCGHSHN